MKRLIFLLWCWHFSRVGKKPRGRDENQTTLILAHRGLTSRHLENTQEAITEAFLIGADGVEFDVQLTKDLVPVVTHDNSLKRLCGLDKNISDMLWREVQTLRQKSQKYAASYRIPTLQEILAAIPPGRLANVELKESVQEKGQAGIKAVLDVIKPFKSKLNIVISSFLPEILYNFNTEDGGYQLGYLIDEDHPLRSYIGGLKILNQVAFLNPHIALVDQATSQAIKKLGVNLIFWGHHELGPEKHIFKNRHYALISDVAEELLAKPNILSTFPAFSVK